MTDYVLGFLFTPAMRNVVLITKTKPEWQAGLLNGVGGKIESGEMPPDAMVREFEEETGVRVPVEAWRHFVRMEGPDWQVYTYVCAHPGAWDVKSPEEESVAFFPVSEVVHRRLATVSNVPWLVAMAANAWTSETFLGGVIRYER